MNDRHSCRHDSDSLASDCVTVTTDELLETIINRTAYVGTRGIWTIPGGYIRYGAKHHLLENPKAGESGNPFLMGHSISSWVERPEGQLC